jgi:flagellin
VSKLQVADGALSQVTSLLNRAVTLSTEASNGGLTAGQQTALDNEFSAIKKEIDSIGQTTTYNGTVVFSGTSAQSNLSALQGSGAVNSTDVVNPASGGGPETGTILQSNTPLDHYGSPANDNTSLLGLTDASNNRYLQYGQAITISGSEGGTPLSGTQPVGNQCFATAGTLGDASQNLISAISNTDSLNFSYKGNTYVAHLSAESAGTPMAQVGTDVAAAMNAAIGSGTDIAIDPGTGMIVYALSGEDVVLLNSSNAAVESSITNGQSTGWSDNPQTLSELLNTIGALTGGTATITTDGYLQINGPAGAANALSNFSLSAPGDVGFNAAFGSSGFTQTQAASGGGGGGSAKNLVVDAGGQSYTFSIAAGATVHDVIQTINGQGTPIQASLDSNTGKFTLTDTGDSGNISIDAATDASIEAALEGSGDTFSNPLLTSSPGVSAFLSDGTQAGSSAISVALNQFDSSHMNGCSLASNNLLSSSGAQSALSDTMAAISTVSALRGSIGAGMNRLQAATNVMNNQTQNLSAAEDGVVSADIGQTVSHLTKYQILSQTAISALAQANSMQKNILQLLQG